MSTNRLCTKCHQFLNSPDEKHTHCFPVSHPELTFTLSTNTPFSILLEVLRRANIKVKQASQSYPNALYEEPEEVPRPCSPPSMESFRRFQKQYLTPKLEEINEEEKKN